MMKQTTKKKITLLLFVSLAIIIAILNYNDNRKESSSQLMLYWLVPDGLRAEPVTFKIFEWANEGKLPNLKRLMDSGAYGHSVPVFPGHTPTNFATLFTGETPKVHGVADGPMHIEGYPLNMVSKSGFSSHAKKIPPIWYRLEREDKRTVSLLSVPGSTPPELNMGTTIKGRWGGWGIEFPATNFHSESDLTLRKKQGPGNRVFSFGTELTKFVKSNKAKSWKLKDLESFTPPQEVKLKQWGDTMYALLVDSEDDGIPLYTEAIISRDKRTVLSRLKVGDWSNWISTTLSWEMQNDYKVSTPKKMNWELSLSKNSIKSQLKVHLIKLGKRGDFRFRIHYSGLNKYLVRPSYLYPEIEAKVGPMVDYPDSFPPQLIYFKNDKKAFIDEMNMSFDWHEKMIKYLIKDLKSEVVIHNIYAPNQMLTSRWWMGYLDPTSSRYNEVTEEVRDKLWNEVLNMYKKVDSMLGQILDNKSENSYVVLSSDHGAIPLNEEVRLNNHFANKGWLKYEMDQETGAYKINWKKTKVVFLKMDAVYINPNGLAGNFKRASGEEYLKLRQKVIESLKTLRNAEGKQALGDVVVWEEASKLGLPNDRVGDLIIVNNPGFGWIEEIDYKNRVFKKALKTGYKQAVIPSKNKGMWTPFVIAGPKIKQGLRIKKAISHTEQYNVLMNALRAKNKKSDLWDKITND